MKYEMFENRLGFIFRLAGQIPVRRHSVDSGAVKACLRVLRDGGVIAIYPEGSRGTGAVDHSHGGAAYLALVTGAPIVPVAVLGTREPGAAQNAVPPRGTRIDTIFGKPVAIQAEPWPRTRQRVDEVRREIQEMLAAHVRAACELTGQTLPAPPVKNES
jgi:1-acyl-sn-glycerol-3-phosphate acyltransferase